MNYYNEIVVEHMNDGKFFVACEGRNPQATEVDGALLVNGAIFDDYGFVVDFYKQLLNGDKTHFFILTLIKNGTTNRNLGILLDDLRTSHNKDINRRFNS